jgi:hypothetical protein
VFAGIDQIAELHERGVLLAVDADRLSPPREPQPAAEERELPGDGALHALLRRAWDRMSGR